MHIAHLIESSGPGGAERMVADLARAQLDRGTPTTVFVPEHGEDWLPEQLAGSAVAVERVALTSPLSPRSVWQLSRAFRRRGVTLVHSHEFSMSVAGACAARATGLPHVITMHGGRYYNGRFQRRLAMRLAVTSSQSTCAVSAELADRMREDLRLTRVPIAVIPNGVTPSARVPSTLRRELALPARVPLIVAVGNLYPVKGHRFLLEALARIRTDAHLVIAGRGDGEAELREVAERLGLTSRLHLLGLRNDVPNLLAGADLFVHPSLAEGLPLALLEAMFAGCPIIASDVGDVERAVGPEGGLLVPPGNAEALAIAIERLLLQPHLARALGASARDRAVDAYGLPVMVDRYAALYAPLAVARRAVQRILLAVLCVLGALGGGASPATAQVPRVAMGESLAQMRSDLTARRYADVLQRGNAMLEAPVGPAPSERMQLWSLLAFAYFPPEPAAQQPDSAALPLAAMVRLVPDIRLDPAVSWPGLDSLLERTRASQFVVVTRPLGEYVLTEGGPAAIDVVTTRPARFRLTSSAIATGAEVTHAVAEGERGASLPLRARVQGADIFAPGAYRLDIWAFDRETGDSVVTSHWATASLLPIPPELLAAPPPRPEPALSNPAAPASTRATTTRVRAQTGRTAIVLGGLALAGATVALATVARPDDAIRATFAADPRAWIVAAAAVGASIFTLTGRWRSPPSRPAPLTMPAARPIAPVAPTAPPARVLLRLETPVP